MSERTKRCCSLPPSGQMETYVLGPHIVSHARLKRSQQPAIILCLFYNGSEADGRANYKKFFDIGTYTLPTTALAQSSRYKVP